MINTNSPTTQQLELISQMSNWGDVGTITVKAMASELLSLRQQIAQMQAPAVEPAQRCNCCGYLVTDSEHKGCLRAAKQEPAQAVPVAWLPIETAPKDGTEILVTYGKQGFVMQLVRFDRTFNYWKNKGEAELGLENNATNWMPIPDPRKPLYTVPPAIDDETCKMALLIREAVNKGIFQGAIRRDAISILSRLTIFHGGENDSSR